MDIIDNLLAMVIAMAMPGTDMESVMLMLSQRLMLSMDIIYTPLDTVMYMDTVVDMDTMVELNIVKSAEPLKTNNEHSLTKNVEIDYYNSYD